MDDDDAFESHYMARLSVLLSEHGVEIRYAKDRAGIDTGLHLFVQGTEGRQATHSRVWFQVKGKRAATLSALEFEAAPTVALGLRPRAGLPGGLRGIYRLLYRRGCPGPR